MSDQKPLLVSIGANHKSAAIDFREELFLPLEELNIVLPKVKENFGLSEVMIISTCNRLELFFVLPNHNQTDLELFEVFISMQELSSHGQRLKKESIIEHCYLFRDREAVEHIFSVASGVDSLVVGETQITGQFKEATAHAKSLNFLGTILERLSQEALGVSKKVRTNTDIGKKTVSISHAAIDLVRQVSGNISDHRFLILGAGEMAAVAAKYLTAKNPKSLVLANRTLRKAEDLVASLGTGSAVKLENLKELMAEADIIISGTSASELVITKEDVIYAQQMRRNRPFFLVDIALPRDISPDCNQLDDVFLFEIDDLKQVVDGNIKERELAAEKAKGIIAESAGQYLKWISGLNIKPVLSGFRSYLDDLIQREAKKTLSKSHFDDLDTKQKSSIENLLQSLAGKISSDAGARIHNPPEGFFQQDLADALKVLFPEPEE